MLRVTTVLARIMFVVALVFCVNAFAFDPGLDTDGDEDLGIAVVMPQSNSPIANIHLECCAEAATSVGCWKPAQLKLFSFNQRTASPLSLLGSPHLVIPLRP
jgi:hypothetical protein